MSAQDSVQDLEKVIVMAMLDRKFRQWLLSDPEDALKTLNIQSTPERVAALRELDMTAFSRVARAFGHPDAGQSRFN